jgi:MEMO1 family protein
MSNRPISKWTRKEAVAGRFYPADKEPLVQLLEVFCSNPQIPNDEKKSPWSIMAPHAGYIYSGRFAGNVYSRIKIPEKVIVLCPNHTGRGKKVSVWSEGEWETPLGSVPVDTKLCKVFMEALPNDAASDQDAHLQEHAIEVHLPFLKFLNPNVSICPITLGPLNYAGCQSVGRALKQTLNSTSTEQSRVLVVASTDMSHYITADEARALDALALDEVRQISGEKLYRSVVENDISMCGFIPTAAMLEAAKLDGVTTAEILCYGNSGERTGDFNSVVAYASAWFFS